MTFTELSFAIGLISILILLPLVVMVLVRVFVRDDPAAESEAEGESIGQFESLGDFWAGMVPHLRELRDRLIKCLLAVGAGTGIGFWIVNSSWPLGKTLPEVLVEHFVPSGIKLQLVGTAEGFVNYMRIALVIGVAIAIPVIVYQIVAFFSPGLLAREKRVLFTALPFVTELFLAGLAFGWFFTIPAALQFLYQYVQSPLIENRPSFESFISTIATLLLWNGAIFEMPALIYLLARLGVVSAAMLASTRRYAVVAITIIAAVITPTGDPYNLLLLAVPMYLLYELGILLARLIPQATARG